MSKMDNEDVLPDVFLPLSMRETTNNVLVKMVAAFNNVEEKIDSTGAIVNQIRRLPVSSDLNKEVDVFYLVLGLIFATVITAGYTYLILGIYCKMCVAIRDFLSERRVCNSFFPNIF